MPVQMTTAHRELLHAILVAQAKPMLINQRNLQPTSLTAHRELPYAILVARVKPMFVSKRNLRALYCTEPAFDI